MTGWRPKLVGAATCLVLIVLGIAMAVSRGKESPLSYSVFSAASAAAAYAIVDPTSPSNATETRHHRRALSSLDIRNRRKPTDGEYVAEKLDNTLHPLSVTRTRMKM